MNAYEHRLAIGRRFGSRVAAGDAVFLSGTGGISDMPFTVTDGERRPLSGMNRLMLMQVMKDQAWSDSRFFTLDQIQKEGWSLGPSARPICRIPDDHKDAYERDEGEKRTRASSPASASGS